MQGLKIAIAVHGRWDAFDLTRELARLGHRVTLLTNYPRWAVERFGVAGAEVRSFWPHGVLSRLAVKSGTFAAQRYFEPALHRLFGTWVAGELDRHEGDVAYVFSGVAEESFRKLWGRDTLRMLVRESAHIRTQQRLLREEQIRTRVPQDRPSEWMLCREEREYAHADVIRVLSSFAYDSFLEEGVPPARVRLVLSGVQMSAFRSSDAAVELRCRRILSGAPLRVLNVGTFAYRKGIWDAAAVIRDVGTSRFEFRFVGPVAAEAQQLATELRSVATFVPKQPQALLPAQYAWADVFMLPTIEDGYAAVLAQAAAASLPILTTSHGAGRDLVRDGHSGWILPIRSPEAFAARLRWADEHRADLAEMLRAIHSQFRPRDFHEVAIDFQHVCMEYLGTAALRV